MFSMCLPIGRQAFSATPLRSPVLKTNANTAMQMIVNHLDQLESGDVKNHTKRPSRKISHM